MNSSTAKLKRKLRVSAKVKASTDRPRLIVTRSNQHIYAQVIDQTGQIVAAASDKNITQGTKTDKAAAVGQAVAKLSKAKKVTKVAFDRGSYRFHGRVKALAQGAREAGLQF